MFRILWTTSGKRKSPTSCRYCHRPIGPKRVVFYIVGRWDGPKKLSYIPFDSNICRKMQILQWVESQKASMPNVQVKEYQGQLPLGLS